MRISKKGDYALRALLYLALHDKKMVQIHDIVTKENIPEKFLEQILLMLKNAGFLQSRRGIGGGYILARSPEKITLGQVIRLIDGPLAPLGCVSKTSHISCPREKSCGLRSVMLDIRNITAEILDHISLADITRRMKGFAKRKIKVLKYYI